MHISTGVHTYILNKYKRMLKTKNQHEFHRTTAEKKGSLALHTHACNDLAHEISTYICTCGCAMQRNVFFTVPSWPRLEHIFNGTRQC